MLRGGEKEYEFAKQLLKEYVTTKTWKIHQERKSSHTKNHSNNKNKLEVIKEIKEKKQPVAPKIKYLIKSSDLFRTKFSKLQKAEYIVYMNNLQRLIKTLRISFRTSSNKIIKKYFKDIVKTRIQLKYQNRYFVKKVEIDEKTCIDDLKELATCFGYSKNFFADELLKIGLIKDIKTSERNKILKENIHLFTTKKTNELNIFGDKFNERRKDADNLDFRIECSMLDQLNEFIRVSDKEKTISKDIVNCIKKYKLYPIPEGLYECHITPYTLQFKRMIRKVELTSELMNDYLILTFFNHFLNPYEYYLANHDKIQLKIIDNIPVMNINQTEKLLYSKHNILFDKPLTGQFTLHEYQLVFSRWVPAALGKLKVGSGVMKKDLCQAFNITLKKYKMNELNVNDTIFKNLYHENLKKNNKGFVVIKKFI